MHLRVSNQNQLAFVVLTEHIYIAAITFAESSHYFTKRTKMKKKRFNDYSRKSEYLMMMQLLETTAIRKAQIQAYVKNSFTLLILKGRKSL